MARIGGGLFRLIQKPQLEIGCYVRVRRSAKLPLASSAGQIANIESNDPLGPYLVSFNNGLRFRYHPEEIVLTETSGDVLFDPPITDPALTDPCPTIDRSV